MSGGTARRVAAQAGMELRLLLRNGENLLVTVGIPVGLLVFFSLVDVLPVPEGEDGTAFLIPGLLGLAVVASGMVSLGIATGFERSYKVLKRLGATPLRRGELVTAKVLAVLAVQAVQAAALLGAGVALGWRPAGLAPAVAVAGVLAGTAAFAGIGMAMAGSLRALATLALTNALFVVLLLTSGILVPLDELPGPLVAVARALPAAPLVAVLRAGLGGDPVAGSAVGVLAAWAVAAPVVAARTFRWE